MIILDTNVISELMKSTPLTKVIHWIDQQDVTQLYITTITIAEIAYGINALPSGKKRHSLENSFAQVIEEAFKHRILSFNEHAAYHYGKLMGHRKTLGQPLSILDGQIAAIAMVNDAIVATRNIKDFAHCHLDLFNPFE